MTDMDLPQDRLPFRPVCGVIPGYPWDEANFVSLEEAVTTIVMHHEHPGTCFFPICDMLAVDPASGDQDERVLWTLAAFLALGFDPRKAVVYRESDIPELFELAYLIGKLEDVRGGPEVALIAAGIVGVRATALLPGGRRSDVVEEARAVAMRVYRRLDIPPTNLPWVRPRAPVDASVDFEALTERAHRFREPPQRLQNALRDGAQSARREVATVLRMLKRRIGIATKGHDVDERSFVQRCAEVDWIGFVAQQRERGRNAASAGVCDQARALHRQARLFSARSSDESVRDMAALVTSIVYPFARENADGVLTYYSYADGALLDWYVQQGPVGVVGQLGHSIDGVRVLLESHRAFEARSLEGAAPYARVKIPSDRLPKRIEMLDDLLADVRAFSRAINFPVGPAGDLPPAVTLDDILREPSLALRLFCPVPQTEFHDEALFLCSVQVSELLFWSLRQLTAASVASATAREMESFVRLATRCAEMLYKSLLVLRTMPNDYFADFREYTGRASAVQSRGYQIFDILYRGADPKKLPHLASFNHLRDLVSWGHVSFRSLAAALKDAPESVVLAARDLDATLLQWRGLHLAFAKTYLPPGVEGTGGTSGAEYLRKFLRMGLFEELGRSVEELDIDADEWDSIGSLWMTPPARISGTVPPSRSE